ncbi:hypothetical protein [Tenacibaculum xiamenense]|uniref:hypothetical protein n=1 Tax=Tenacibaculum xiamenense TaxID=1261553 RepID=UPI0038961843
MEKEYKNLGFVLLILIPITIFGFLKSYLSGFPDFEKDPGTAIHFHFTISAIWIVLFIVQPISVRFKKFTLHKTLGKLSYLLFVLLMISFIPLFIEQIEYNYLPLTILTTSDMVSVVLFYGLAIYYKRNIPIHIRYMIVLSIVFALPAIGRIFMNWLGFSLIENMIAGYVILISLLIVLIILDKKKKKNVKPYLLGVVFFTLKQFVFILAFYKVI